MPKALSTHPDPYRHDFPRGKVGDIYTGWAYPPNDYQKWSEVVFQFVRHLRDRYGDAEVKTWLWEVWNEPDIGYWQGTREEYFKLYDFSVEAMLRALPEARIGGPDTTGPLITSQVYRTIHRPFSPGAVPSSCLEVAPCSAA
jgi:xylan 1,4-beta-xylosidase